VHGTCIKTTALEVFSNYLSSLGAKASFAYLK